MPERNLLRRAIEASTRFARAGDPQQALLVLDDSIGEAIRSGRADWVSLLTSNAVILCDVTGDLTRARRYCEQCLAHVPDDPWTAYRLANVLLRQGESDLAKRHAARSYSLVTHSDRKRDRGLIDLLAKEWPEVSKWASEL
jgi:hypothetical protein